MTESVSRYRSRALVLTGCLVLLLGAIVVRLGYLQIVRHDELARLAERQYSKTIPLRTEIFAGSAYTDSTGALTASA